MLVVVLLYSNFILPVIYTLYEIPLNIDYNYLYEAVGKVLFPITVDNQFRTMY